MLLSILVFFDQFLIRSLGLFHSTRQVKLIYSEYINVNYYEQQMYWYFGSIKP